MRALAILAGVIAYTMGFTGPETGAIVGAVNLGLGLYVFGYYTGAVASK